MERTRLVATLAAVALLACACNGSSSAGVAPSPSPSDAAASPSSEPSPSPSPSPTEVLPANDVEDPVEALEAIVRYRDWLFENPDPDKLKLIYAERCPCYKRIHAALSEAAESGNRVEFLERSRLEFLETEDQEGPFAQLRYRIWDPAARSLSSTGEVLEERPASSEPSELVAGLVQEGGRWVVVFLA